MRVFRNRHGQPTIMQRFLANVHAAGLSQSVLPLRLPSISGIKLLRILAAERKIATLPQALYLDSAHERGETLVELQVAWHALPVGGILYGDDWAWPAVRHDVSAFASCLRPMGRTARGIAWNLTTAVGMPIMRSGHCAHYRTVSDVINDRSFHGKNAFNHQTLVCMGFQAPNGTESETVHVAAREVLLMKGAWMLIKGPGDDDFLESARHNLPWCQFLREFSLLRAGSDHAAGHAAEPEASGA